MVELLKVIKFEGDKDTLVWKHPAEDFNTHSKLIVHESQVAIFYKDGKALDEFGPGKYTLETGNIPILRGLINIPTEGVSQFHCEVYFINKATSLNVVWGTSSRFPVIEPTFKIPINVGASGMMDIVIDDARKFMVNVMGTQTFNTTDQLTDYFKGKITTKVKNYLSKIMSEVSYYNITQHLEEISEALHAKLKEDFAEYGVNLVTFYISNIVVPKEETKKLEDVLNKKMEYGTLGFNWADEQMADVAKKYAENPGNKGGVDGMVAGFPMAMAFGQMLGQWHSARCLETMWVEACPEDFLQGVKTLEPTSSNKTRHLNNRKIMNLRVMLYSVPNVETSGNKLAPDAMFCSKCGNKVQQELKCGNCGRKLEPDDLFCSGCGHPVNE